MLFVDNLNEHDASVNLALEEFMQQKSDLHEDLVLFYINAPSIIIGRHQNTLEEINRKYVEDHHIRVVRRLSGGGAVYHDLGNLNFSFITDYQPEHFQNFKRFTEPVVRALQKLGVPAELTGRNDIQIDERKVSGNAQYISRGRLVSHGTLLFNSDLSHVSEALNVHEAKIASKGIKSVRSRVVNISEFLKEPMDIETFKQHILHTYFEGEAEIQRYPLSEADWVAVRKLAEERYRSWDWTYGRSPDFNVEKRQRFTGGEIDARLDVKKGVIQCIKFYGDFFSELDPADVEKKLVGMQYSPDSIRSALQNIEIGRYLPGQDVDSLTEFLS
jgi:lipoate-protein ligase A